MRALLLIFMIALLPLRGWQVQAMAAERPAASSAPAPHECHVVLDKTGEPQVHPHGAAVDGTDPVVGEQTDCKTCQLCHTAGLAPRAQPPSPATPRLAAPRTLQQLHASAERAPEHKPPIG